MPKSRFVEWITDTGPQEVARRLGVKPSTVYGWRRHAQGKQGGNRPDPMYLAAILKLGAGKLIAADIYPEQAKLHP